MILEKAISMGVRSGLQETKPYAFFFQRLCRLSASVNRESVKGDHVASLKRWYKSGLDAAVKEDAVHGVMDNHGAVRPWQRSAAMKVCVTLPPRFIQL